MSTLSANPRLEAPDRFWFLLLLLALFSGGCGSTPEVRPGPSRSTKVSREAKLVPLGPTFDQSWATLAPNEGFLYLAFQGESLQKKLDEILPGRSLGTKPPFSRGSGNQGLSGWLVRLQELAGEAPLFPEGAGLLLDASTSGLAEDFPLDFWLATPASAALESTLSKLRQEEAGVVVDPDRGKLFLARRTLPGKAGTLRILTSRAEWAGAREPGTPWFLAPKTTLSQRAGAFGVLSLERYSRGALGERTRLRSPREFALLETWGGLTPLLTVEVTEFSGGLAVDLGLPLEASHPRWKQLVSLFPSDETLRSPTRVPSASPLYLAASLDWAAWKDLRESLGAIAAVPPPSTSQVVPSSPFDPRQGSPVPSPQGVGAALSEGAGQIGEMLQGALLDWAGPEVALVATWDTRYPRGGVMIQGRDAKAAIGAIRRYRASDVGQKMRFVDAQVGDVPYRYTRLDGVDPNWLEPAYGFVGPNLCITSARSLLERLLDEEAPKIEETPAFGGLFSKLGKNLRLAAYLDPAVLPRLQQLLAKMAPGAKTQDPAASKPLEAFSQGVSGLALGAGLRDQKELRVALVISLREEAKGEEEETPRATLTDTTQSGKMAPLNLPAKPEIEH